MPSRSRVASPPEATPGRLDAFVDESMRLTADNQGRAKCMEALLPELEAQAVVQVWLEARTSSLVRRDLRLVDALRSRQLSTPGMRVDTALPSEEPMLWLPDAVAGAVAAARDDESQYLALIGPVRQIEVSIR